MPHELDERQFPVVRCAAVGTSTDDEVRERQAFFERQLARGSTLALIMDSSKVEPITAAQRKMWVDWLSKHRQLIRSRVVLAAIVGTSHATRGIYTAIFWVWKPPIQIRFVDTVTEAEAAAREALAGAGETSAGNP